MRRVFYKLLRWLMNKLIALLLTKALNPLVKAAVAGMGPSLRAVNLDTAGLNTLMALIADKFAGKAVVYTVMGQYTAVEQQAIVEGFHDAIKAVLTAYAITLTPDQLSTVLKALGTEVAAKYPRTATTAA